MRRGEAMRGARDVGNLQREKGHGESARERYSLLDVARCAPDSHTSP